MYAKKRHQHTSDKKHSSDGKENNSSTSKLLNHYLAPNQTTYFLSNSSKTTDHSKHQGHRCKQEVKSITSYGSEESSISIDGMEDEDCSSQSSTMSLDAKIQMWLKTFEGNVNLNNEGMDRSQGDSVHEIGREVLEKNNVKKSLVAKENPENDEKYVEKKNSKKNQLGKNIEDLKENEPPGKKIPLKASSTKKTCTLQELLENCDGSKKGFERLKRLYRSFMTNEKTNSNFEAHEETNRGRNTCQSARSKKNRSLRKKKKSEKRRTNNNNNTRLDDIFPVVGSEKTKSKRGGRWKISKSFKSKRSKKNRKKQIKGCKRGKCSENKKRKFKRIMEEEMGGKCKSCKIKKERKSNRRKKGMSTRKSWSAKMRNKAFGRELDASGKIKRKPKVYEEEDPRQKDHLKKLNKKNMEATENSIMRDGKIKRKGDPEIKLVPRSNHLESRHFIFRKPDY